MDRGATFWIFSAIRQYQSFPGGGGRICKSPGCLPYLLGVKNAVLVPLKVFSLKRSTVGALAKYNRG